MRLQIADFRLQIHCRLVGNLKFNLQSAIYNLQFHPSHEVVQW
jgi:hypothetical protein